MLGASPSSEGALEADKTGEVEDERAGIVLINQGNTRVGRDDGKVLT